MPGLQQCHLLLIPSLLPHFLIPAGRKVPAGKQAHQLTSRSCCTPPKIRITPSISCSRRRAQYCILHPEEKEMSGEACRSCSCNNPFLVAQGNQGSYSLHSIFTREGADTRSRSEPVIFPFDLWPGGLGVSSRCLAAREERSGHCGCAEGVQQFGRSL